MYKPNVSPSAEAALPERKGERTRRRILAAARRRFAEVGYERATIRAIAAEAGVDKSSVMQYFGSKQELFREAVRWHIPHDELTTDDPRQVVENHLRAMLGNWAAEIEKFAPGTPVRRFHGVWITPM